MLRFKLHPKLFEEVDVELVAVELVVEVELFEVEFPLFDVLFGSGHERRFFSYAFMQESSFCFSVKLEHPLQVPCFAE